LAGSQSEGLRSRRGGFDTFRARYETGRQPAPTSDRAAAPSAVRPHGVNVRSGLGLLTALYFWNGSFVPTAMGSSQSSGYGSTRVERRSRGPACRLEARTHGSTWATGASSASGAPGRTARPCASSARGQTSLVTATAVTTISPGEFSSNSFTSADSGGTDGTALELNERARTMPGPRPTPPKSPCDLSHRWLPSCLRPSSGGHWHSCRH
jgi:hypothetical protein